MSLVDEIGKLLSKLPPLVKVDVKQPTVINNLNITNDSHAQAVTYNQTDKSCTVNLGKLSDSQKKEFMNSIVDGGDILLLEKAKCELEDFRLQEETPETQDIIQWLSGIIPLEDLNIWRAALYLRSCFEKKMSASVTKIKMEIMQKYGDKGRNIANLCTAGYLEEWLIPAYTKLKQTSNDEEAKSSFVRLYTLLVNELPFTIFVCQKMTLEDLRQEIDSRKKYGMDFVNIHAIGEDNIKKIKTVVEETEKDSYSEDKKGHIIFVRVGFKKDEQVIG